MKLSRLITLVCTLIFSAAALFAQSSGDRLYNQGLQLQKTMTIQAQNSAISKFSSAKKLYDSAAKKSQCDQAISVSRNIISSLKGGKGGGGVGQARGSRGSRHNEPVQKEEVKPTLSVTNSEFNVDLSSRTLNVGVNTNQPEWNVNTVACEDGTSFLTVNKNGSNGIDISVTSNSTSMIRTQKVVVTAGNLTREIAVTQTGRPIDLDANTKIFEFKEKGGKKKLNILCNSDYKYAENSDENWYIESQPSWVKIVLNEKRDKSKVEELGSKVTDFFKGKSKDDDPNMVKTSITLSCDHLVPGTIEAHNGRKGEVIIRSGDKTVTLYVTQLGKASTVR